MPTPRAHRARALAAALLTTTALAAESSAAPLVTSFRLASDDAASAHVSELAGRGDAGAARRLAVWLRPGTGARVSVARDVPVAGDGTWRLALASAVAPVALDGLTVQRWLVCAYDAADPHADPADPATLDCGPHAGGGADPRYDVDLDTLALEDADGGSARRLETYLLARELTIASAFVLDGAELGGSEPDGAWTWHDFAASPPGRTIGGYRASGDCPPGSSTGAEWCDAAPRIAAAPSGGGELAHVHGGVLAAAPGHALIAFTSEVREPAAPALPFDAFFGPMITLEPAGLACGERGAGGGASTAALVTRGTTLLAVLGPTARRRARRWSVGAPSPTATPGGRRSGRAPAPRPRPACKALALQNRKATAPHFL